MKYNKNIIELFKSAIERDRDKYIKDFMLGWSYQDDARNQGRVSQDHFLFEVDKFNGPHELSDWLLWYKNTHNYDNFFKNSLTAPLMDICKDFDSRIIENYNIDYNYENYDRGVARNNAEDYILANAYPMQESLLGRKVLDFGAGYGRQACLWNLKENPNSLYVAVEGIPKSYCMQHFYLSNFDRPFYEYMINQEIDFKPDLKGIAHIPTWRLDLIPDNYFDKILTVQVLPELGIELLNYALNEFKRILKPNGMIYVRDHKNGWQPVHKTNIDDAIISLGFHKEFELLVKDRENFQGIPRIFRKIS